MADRERAALIVEAGTDIHDAAGAATDVNVSTIEHAAVSTNGRAGRAGNVQGVAIHIERHIVEQTAEGRGVHVQGHDGCLVVDGGIEDGDIIGLGHGGEIRRGPRPTGRRAPGGVGRALQPNQRRRGRDAVGLAVASGKAIVVVHAGARGTCLDSEGGDPGGVDRVDYIIGNVRATRVTGIRQIQAWRLGERILVVGDVDRGVRHGHRSIDGQPSRRRFTKTQHLDGIAGGQGNAAWFGQCGE